MPEAATLKLAVWHASAVLFKGRVVTVGGTHCALAAGANQFKMRIKAQEKTFRDKVRRIPLGGSIRFADEEVTGLRPHEMAARGIAHVPEGRQLFPMMTVHENLAMGGYLPAAKAARSESLERAYALFPRLRERQAQLAGSLSGGEQQMLAIARGLMLRPRLLMLDEPSLGLAPLLVQEIFETLARLRDEGITILLVEQNVPQALRLAGIAYVLENGRIALHGPAGDLLGNAHVRAAYLGV